MHLPCSTAFIHLHHCLFVVSLQSSHTSWVVILLSTFCFHTKCVPLWPHLLNFGMTI